MSMKPKIDMLLLSHSQTVPIENWSPWLLKTDGANQSAVNYQFAARSCKGCPSPAWKVQACHMDRTQLWILTAHFRGSCTT